MSAGCGAKLSARINLPPFTCGRHFAGHFSVAVVVAAALATSSEISAGRATADKLRARTLTLQVCLRADGICEKLAWFGLVLQNLQAEIEISLPAGCVCIVELLLLLPIRFRQLLSCVLRAVQSTFSLHFRRPTTSRAAPAIDES